MILVTGANGLIGSAIVRRLVQAGESVRGLRRANSNISTLQGIDQQIEWVEGDILDVPSLEQSLIGIEYVIHAAAIVSFVPRDRAAMYKVNVEGTANVVNACLKAGVKKLAYLSSVAALGRPANLSGNQPIVISEAQKWEESPHNSHYAKTKYLAELEVWRGIAEGLSAVMVNPSVVLGEGDWQRSSIQLFKYVWQEKPFYPAGTINYVDVQDVAEIIVRLLQSDLTNQRFILSAGSLSYRDFLWKIADNFEKKRPSYAVSRWVSEVAWRVEALRTWLTGQSPLVTKETARTSRHSFEYLGEKVQKATNFQYTTLNDTLYRVCKFFKNKAPDLLRQ